MDKEINLLVIRTSNERRTSYLKKFPQRFESTQTYSVSDKLKTGPIQNKENLNRIKIHRHNARKVLN